MRNGYLVVGSDRYRLILFDVNYQGIKRSDQIMHTVSVICHAPVSFLILNDVVRYTTSWPRPPGSAWLCWSTMCTLSTLVNGLVLRKTSRIWANCWAHSDTTWCKKETSVERYVGHHTQDIMWSVVLRWVSLTDSCSRTGDGRGRQKVFLRPPSGHDRLCLCGHHVPWSEGSHLRHLSQWRSPRPVPNWQDLQTLGFGSLSKSEKQTQSHRHPSLQRCAWVPFTIWTYHNHKPVLPYYIGWP